MQLRRPLLLLVACTSLPATAAPTADEIIDQARSAQRVDSSVQSMRMVLVARNGAERVRELDMKVRTDGDVVKSYTRFTHPTDVAGTQLVLVDHPDQADEQLLYLPALKRVNRIAGKARRGAFMGSDFLYEDLEISSASDARHTLVEETGTTWVIDSIPGSDSSYGRLRVHVDRADHLPHKVEFFDRADQPIKVLEVERTERDGDAVIPTRSVMRNLQKGTSTRLEVLSHQVDVPREQLPDEVFTAEYMERNG